jgi:hypothetical protein
MRRRTRRSTGRQAARRRTSTEMRMAVVTMGVEMLALLAMAMMIIGSVILVLQMEVLAAKRDNHDW